MSVDFKNEANILAIHGVQVGEDESVKSDKQIRKLLNSALSRSHIERDYSVSGFLYEDINDEAQQFYSTIAGAITAGRPLARLALKSIVDVAGDVVTAARNTSTAKKIRNKLLKQILESYTAGNQLVLVSHSLGTIYALDAICELMRKSEYFSGDDKTTWPVQGLITMGSPLGLDLNIADAKIFEMRKIETIENIAFEAFPWHNYYNRLDPIVSGSVFGKPVKITGAKGPVERRYGNDTKAAQWLLRGHAVTSGKQWLLAHTAYWKNPKIGDRLVDLLW
jgi:hypothetical protein